MNAGEYIDAATARLTDRQKLRVGGLLLVFGTVLIGLLVWTDVGGPVEVVAAVVAVLLMVAGTLGVGTSGVGGRRSV